MTSSQKLTNSSGTDDYDKSQTVNWYLVNKETNEVICSREDIVDLIEIRKHSDAPTTLTDTPPENHD